jgi:RNA polymerase sigma factor (sigma-70 family)
MTKQEDPPLDCITNECFSDRIPSIVTRVWRRCGTALTSDIRHDCEALARLVLWQISDRVAGLPDGQREAYADTCIRQALHRFLAHEGQYRARTVWLEDVSPEYREAGQLIDESAAEWEALFADTLFDHISRSDLALAFSSLSDRDRLILDQYYRREQTDNQIAGSLDVTTISVKLRRHRAIKKIRQILGLE